MTGGSSYTNVFGGNAVRPAQPSYLALSIAINTALVWPLETTEGQPVVAAQLDVVATVASLYLAMPPGNTGSTGVQTIITNVGSNTFTVTDTAGNTIVAIPTTQSWIVALTDNTSTNGTWTALQLASTTSSATAASLAGPALQVNGSGKLQPFFQTVIFNTDMNAVAADRGKLFVWDKVGGTGTLQFDTSANLGNGWFCSFTNEGTAGLFLTGTGGELINGQASLTIEPGNSGFLVAGSGVLNTVGAIAGVLSIEEGGTGAANAGVALQNFGGTTLGIGLFTAPNAASARSLLGLSNLNFTAGVVSTNQSPAPSDGNTNYLLANALTITLPLTTSVTTQYVLIVNAIGGGAALTPQASDKINGGAAGASFTVQQGGSCLICTDANGDWYISFYGLPATGGTVTGNVTVFGTLATSSDATIGGNLATSGTFIASDSTIFGTMWATVALEVGSVGNVLLAGTGDPNGAVTANNASLFMRFDGGTGTRIYVNQGGGTTWGAIAGV